MQSYFNFIDLPECSSEDIPKFNRSPEKMKYGTCHRDECQIRVHYTYGEETFKAYCELTGEIPEN